MCICLLQELLKYVHMFITMYRALLLFFDCRCVDHKDKAISIAVCTGIMQVIGR